MSKQIRNMLDFGLFLGVVGMISVQGINAKLKETEKDIRVAFQPDAVTLRLVQPDKEVTLNVKTLPLPFETTDYQRAITALRRQVNESCIDV